MIAILMVFLGYVLCGLVMGRVFFVDDMQGTTRRSNPKHFNSSKKYTTAAFCLWPLFLVILILRMVGGGISRVLFAPTKLERIEANKRKINDLEIEKFVADRELAKLEKQVLDGSS